LERELSTSELFEWIAFYNIQNQDGNIQDRNNSQDGNLQLEKFKANFAGKIKHGR